MKEIRYALAWVLVRPRRWFFRRMIGACYPHWIPRKEWYGWRLPNIHWWLLYCTVFRFFAWLHWEAWRPFCKWDTRRLTYPLIARVIHRIGSTTAGCALGGGECYHCASEDGDPVWLSDDDTGTTFILEDSGTSSTPDGIDHWFSGTTICPRCGYRDEYSDGSL